MYIFISKIYEIHFFLFTSGDREDFIGEYVDSEWQRWILDYQTQNAKVVCQKGNSPEQRS